MPSTTSSKVCHSASPHTPARRRHHDHPIRRNGSAHQAPARPDDLAGGLPDPHRPQPRPERLAPHTVARRPHLRAGHHRSADRHLRSDAPAAPRPRPAPDSSGEHLMRTAATTPVNLTGAGAHSISRPVARADSSVRRTSRIVGILFLAGFLAYGVGNLIATDIVRSDDRSGSTTLFVTGAALMLLNSAFVIGIGVLMLPILRPHNRAIAAGYLGTRIFEGVVLAIGVVSLIVLSGSAAIDANAVYYNIAEAGLGIGSLFFCALLFRTGLVPRFLAVWGFIGYACFAGGTLLELSGVAGAGLVGAIPGGLFELTFGIWLIARGFASTATVRSRASTAVAPA